jgi:hypothetical protein
MKLSITAADLRIALDNLFSDPARLNLFKTTAAFVVYGAEMDAIRTSLPLIVKGNRPLAKDLNTADIHHDSLGSAIWLLTEALKTHPSIDSTLRDKVSRIQAQFIPNMAVLTAKYKKEAQVAALNRSKVPDFEADLRSIATPDGRTLYDWVIEFLDSGDHIAKLLDARSKVEANEPGVELVMNRTKALTLVSKARELVAEEAKKSSTLPKNAEAIVFGYFDTLASFRSSAKNNDQEPPPPAAPAPATP